MISGLALAIAVYVIVIPTPTERHDVSQILLFSPLLRVITLCNLLLPSLYLLVIMLLIFVLGAE